MRFGSSVCLGFDPCCFAFVVLLSAPFIMAVRSLPLHAPPHPSPPPAIDNFKRVTHSKWQRCPTSEMRSWRDDYLRDGLVIARRFLDESTLMGIQRDLEEVVESYEEKLLGGLGNPQTIFVGPTLWSQITGLGNDVLNVAA